MKITSARTIFLTSILRGLTIFDTWRKATACDVLLIGHEHHFNYIYDGKIYSPLLGSILERLERNGQKVSIILKPFSAIRPQRLWRPGFTFNYFHFVTLLIAFAGKIFRSNSLQSIAKRREIHFWRRLFSVCAPSKIIAITPEPAICNAARQLGIPIADLQHGVINSQHPYYGESFKKNRPSEDFPTEYLLWDKESSESLLWVSTKGARLTIIGHPWFERFLHPSPDDNLVISSLSQSKLFLKNKPTILVTLQWGLEKYIDTPDFNGFMCEGLEKAIIRTQDAYNWMLRLHPVQLHGQRRIETLRYLESTFSGCTAVEWVKSSYIPLPIALKLCDLHITSFSTVVREAAWMNIPSALTDREVAAGGKREGYFVHEKASGLAQVVGESTEDIMAWIRLRLLERNRLA